MSKKLKKKQVITEEMRSVLNYILETEQADYVDWCSDEGHEIDSKEAIDAHVFGSACKVLGHKPSYFLNEEND